MYVTFGEGETEYTSIRNLSFSPQTDLTGSAMPINELQVDIRTTDSVSIGEYVCLYDDLDNLWARYWIVYAEHIDAGTLRIRAQSPLALLDRRTMEPQMLEDEPVTNVLSDIFESMESSEWGMDSSFDEVTLSGYVPEQTARERLQWVCFVMGAYVRTYFTDRVWIRPIDDTTTLVPISNTFWKPTVNFADWVTAISVKVYAYTEGTPQTTDKWVEVDGTYYIQTEDTVTLTNSSAPAAAPENVVKVEGLYLLNDDNVSDVLNHLAPYYFKRTSMELDAINNAAYMPGDNLTVYADADTMYSGFVESCAFSFGVQARAKMRLTAVEDVSAAKLTILYVWNGVQVGKKEYTFPVGYGYEINNPYIDFSMNRHRYVFRPTTAKTTGTMVAGGVEVTVQCAVALDLYKKVLKIVSVDEVTEDSSGDVVVGVIE